MPAAAPAPRPPPPPARPAPGCPTRPAPGKCCALGRPPGRGRRRDRGSPSVSGTGDPAPRAAGPQCGSRGGARSKRAVLRGRPGKRRDILRGHRGLCGHSLKCLSSRITEQKLQGTWLPAGRGSLEKPFLGSRSSVVPAFSPQSGLHPVHAENSPLKPTVVTVVKVGGHPLRKVTLLLNRRSVQTFEQLLADVSEALGFPRWKSDRVRKLFNLKGREIRSVSDFFREGDAFIAVGKEPLTLKNIQVAIEELYPSKARALTLTQQHSQIPSPRPRSRLYSKAVKGGHPCGETETTKSSGEAARSPAAIRPQGQTPGEDRVRTPKKWGKGKREPESGSKAPKDAALERRASGEKHLAVEIEKTSGELIRCEKCKRERELQQGLQRERLSLGTSELDLGRCPRYDVERLVRTRSCRRSPEEKLQGGEEGWKEGPRSSPGHPSQEPRRPSKSVDRKEDRDPGGQAGHPPAAAKAKRDVSVGEAQPRREEKDSRNAGRSKPGGWLRREHHADLDPEKLPRTRGAEQEAEKEKPVVSGARRMMVPRDEPPAGIEKEPRTRPEESKAERPGRRRRPAGILAADVRKQYEPGRVIGDGNFAVVKECRHRGTRQAYAMKIIDKSKLKGKEDMVDSEILIIQSLSHPNIVKLHEVYETDAEIYLIMEYVQGGDLFDAIIESVKFPEREAALMLMDLCKALVHLHDKRIVHRDLKPENLLVQRNEDKSTTLKLADFGLAKHVVRPIFTVCGTPTYVAPEILSEKGYGLEVDMWAAGVILYILLCGFPPFRSPERDQEELFNIIQLGRFEFLAPYWDNISDAAKDLVSRLLVVNPKKRYTAHQVLQHPWLEAAGKTSRANLRKEVPPSSEDHFRS
ncbi:serine/threonine-protein kinase DCLK3 [Budorcas taxicolor]|uniref:serine/threonine-protein kinase DCLK3 n=1 Tax=Budorcas taxicolor TaxID=37181 RepID=UPI002284EE31|nr:serine/threonine-protein kinase DCLK3 [Budorcas taxicolor]